MYKSRFARSFTASLALVASLLAIPLIRCSTSAASGSGGVRASAATGNCNSSPNPQTPVICITTAGVDPKTILVNSTRNGGGPVTIVMMGPPTTTLGISTSGSCSNVVFSACGHGPVCNATTVPGQAGTCTYTASLNGVTVTDPVIETDTCCGTDTGGKGKPH